jgi:hypothetical protein
MNLKKEKCLNTNSVLIGIMLINILSLIVSVSYHDLFNVICFSIILLGLLFYYMESK